MRHEIFTISGEAAADSPAPQSRLSFQPFLRYIRERMEDGETIKRDIYNLILHKFSKYPETEAGLTLEDSSRYTDLFNLLYIALSTVVEDEKKLRWGLSLPGSPVLFYGSGALYDLLAAARENELPHAVEGLPPFDRQKLELLYAFVLNRVYNLQGSGKQDIIQPVYRAEAGLVKYYRVHVDMRFVDVNISQPLPELNLETLQVSMQENNALELLEQHLPLSLFGFSGFSLITITDVTEEFALDRIKDVLVNGQGKTDEASYRPVVESLKAIAGNSAIEFGLLPLIRVNNRIVEDIDAYCHSILFTMGKQKNITRSVFLPLFEKFVSNPRLIFFRDLDIAAPAPELVGQLLLEAGVKSYALLPVYFHRKLVGTFEIYCRQRNVLSENTFARIESAIPLIAQLMRNSIEEFENRITDTIRDKFTSLQPSVQWKFNEAAWDYIYRSKMEGKHAEVQKIEFRQVYPIYSAVDMRNSTIERNKAVLADLKFQFSLLCSVFEAMRDRSGFALTDEFIFKCSKWQQVFDGIFTANDELRVNQFLNEEAHPFLRHFKDADPALTPRISEYFDAIRQNEGRAWENRRQLEESMQMVNNAINNYLELMNEELQRAFPCYFEKFRTDGVEYDIYIGQSIAPGKPFDLVYLKNIRLWQLTSMAAIAKLSHALQPRLKVPLETTQLIFIYSSPIDVSFRNDERRFDVEGGYNIRYHIIKKRIDKVTLRNSRERLTQPGKIAMIYLNQKDADEYLSYIHHLQEKKMLQDDLEYLELEDVQGVSGLRALRVGVNTREPETENEVSTEKQKLASPE